MIYNPTPYLIIEAQFGKVQFMYWRNREQPYLNVIYYQDTLGL